MWIKTRFFFLNIVHVFILSTSNQRTIWNYLSIQWKATMHIAHWKHSFFRIFTICLFVHKFAIILISPSLIPAYCIASCKSNKKFRRTNKKKTKNHTHWFKLIYISCKYIIKPLLLQTKRLVDLEIIAFILFYSCFNFLNFFIWSTSKWIFRFFFWKLLLWIKLYLHLKSLIRGFNSKKKIKYRYDCIYLCII